MHAFHEFGSLVAGSVFRAKSYFNYFVESDSFNGCKNLSRGSVKLPIDSWGRDGNNLFIRVRDAFVHVDDFGAFHDGTVRAGLHTLSAIDTFIFVNMFRAVFSFGDCFYRTYFLARYGSVHDRVVGAHFGTKSAAHAVFLCDRCFAAFEGDGGFRAVHQAGTSLATPAHVGHEILRLHTRATSFVYHGKNILFRVLVVQGFLREFS